LASSSTIPFARAVSFSTSEVGFGQSYGEWAGDIAGDCMDMGLTRMPTSSTAQDFIPRAGALFN